MYLSNSFGREQRAKVDSGEYAGWFVSPFTFGVPAGVRAGQAWAGDNGCFSKAFTPETFAAFLDDFEPYRAACLFLTVPDVVGDCYATKERWRYWRPKLDGWPLAFVGQDGQTSELVPWDNIACYFVGGTDDWKDGAESLSLVSEARDRGTRVHVGRCNTGPRLTCFVRAYKRRGDGPILPSFTYDGNGIRMPGKNRELAPAQALLSTEWLL